MTGQIGTADLYDEYEERLQSCDLQLKQTAGDASLPGRSSQCVAARTTRWSRRSSTRPARAGVLVVDGGGSLHTALLGDLIGAAAVENGWAGAVVNGAVRDVLALGLLDLGVKALGSNPRKSAKLVPATETWSSPSAAPRSRPGRAAGQRRRRDRGPARVTSGQSPACAVAAAVLLSGERAPHCAACRASAS